MLINIYTEGTFITIPISMRKISFFTKPPSNFDDKELWKKIAEGEDRAFEILYERYNKWLYNYIWTMLNFNTDEAGFVLSDVFIKAYEYIQSKDVDNIKWLLYKIAHNTTIDRIKTQKDKHPKVSEDEYTNYEDHSDYTEKKWVNTEFKKKVLQKYLTEIDEKYRSILYLSYYENKSYDEIAEIQQSNKNSIGTLVFQWKKKLEDLLRNTGIDINIFLE